MSSLNTDWNVILGMSCLAGFVLIVGISIIVYPFIKKKISNNSKSKEKITKRYSQGDFIAISEESPNSETEDFLNFSRKNSNLEKTTEIECAIEYRTRGSQLIVIISKVYPTVLIHNIVNSKNMKIYFVVYLNGDYTNTPCESTKNQLRKVVDLNEIFIFTVMPYDLSSLELEILMILSIDDKKSIIGTLKLPLHELDQQSFLINKTYSIPYPEEIINLPDCLLCLSITNCRNLIKMKIIRLHIFDCSFPDDHVTGLSLKLIMEIPNKPDQILLSSKKKYKSALMFNETLIFETQDTDKRNVNLKIQLLESYGINGDETILIRGFIDMKSDSFDGNSFNRKWTEALDNMDSEIICWYSLSYEK